MTKRVISATQTRLWFLQQLQPETALYHVSLAVRIVGPVVHTRLQESIQQVCQQHNILRSYFTAQEGVPYREEAAQVMPELPVTAVSDEDEVTAILEEMAVRPFPLHTPPLIRFHLATQTAENHTLLIIAHRLVADFTALTVLYQHIASVYTKGSCTASDYTDKTAETKTELTYWQAQLAYLPLLVELPFDYARPARQTHHGGQQQFTLAAEVVSQLHHLAAVWQLPVNTLLLAAFQVLLHRYTGQTGIIVGQAVSLSPTEIGPHENEVVLRMAVEPTDPFSTHAQTVQHMYDAAQAHKTYPFTRLIEQLQPDRDLSHTPLFQIAFACHQQQPPLTHGDVTWQPYPLDDKLAAYDLSLAFYLDDKENIQGVVTYNSDLFAPATINRLAGHLQTLLAGIVSAPDTPLAYLPLLTIAEQRQIQQWNSTTLPFDQSACIHQLFERQVAQVGGKTAVSYLEDSLTYAELNGRANQLARHLQTLGVQTGDLIAVCMERTLDLIISLLAICKAGAAYVPLDPDYPADRIQFMMSDSEARILLTQSKLQNRLPAHHAHVVPVDTSWADLSKYNSNNLNLDISAQSLAYIIYTSGSTGRPKGVAIAHSNAVAMISWAQSLYTPTELAGVLAVTSVCFDLSVYEIFVPLSSGGAIILARNALHLIDLPHREQVTLINTVPSAMTELVRAKAIPANVRVVNLAGEPLKDTLVQAIYAQETIEKVYDLYGPSEDTTYSTWLLMARGINKEPSVGWPIANTQAHVLDKFMQPVPIGVIGELYLGGAGVSRGYLHRPELTAARFIPDPFLQGNGEVGGGESSDAMCLYKTGDLVRYRPNGELDFLGRIDHQVKVRGFRIELGEIEARLNQHQHIQGSVVTAVPDTNGILQLIAYLVPTNGHTPTRDEIRQHLHETLPDYMIPSIFIFLETFPLTPNGKINRRALPVPDQENIHAEVKYEPPITETEQLLAALWQDLLHVDQIGRNDHFFHLGGHSLLATRLISHVRGELNVELSLLNIFDMPTLSEMASFVTNKLIQETDNDELAMMLQQLESLSDEEIDLLLTQES